MLRLTSFVGIAVLVLACSPSSSGEPDGGDAAVTFTYTPQGCSYTVTPPDARGFVSPTLDDGAPITDATGGAPIRVRLGLGGGAEGADPTTTVAFTWETAAQIGAAQVRIGTQPTALSDVHKGYSWLTPPPSVGFGTTDAPANMHEVHVCGLSAGTTYYYQVGGGVPGQEAWSATQSFTTLPAAGPIVVGVSGDSRDDASVFQLVQERMRDGAAAMQIFSGDFVLWGASEALYQQWLDKAWKDPVDSSKFLTLGQQLILPVAGNHENSSAQFYGNFALPGDGPFAEEFFSVDVGSAHILQFDDQSIATAPGSDEAKAALAFIDSDLGKAEQNRAARPFLIVEHHRGEFSTANHGTDADVVATRNTLFPIFTKHHVDLVLNGHDHDYERSNPINGDPTNPTVVTDPTQGVSYVVCAGAGAGAYSPSTTPVAYRAINAGFGGTTPYVGVYALMTLDAHTLAFKAYGLKASGGGVAGDDVLDTLTLTR
ncbi:MAG TPA: metallophosphoesterase family protein [Polyangiaceae bacterium]|nr:metallophosphoesterase family protein [Polyangiaceae bacterium]